MFKNMLTAMLLLIVVIWLGFNQRISIQTASINQPTSINQISPDVAVTSTISHNEIFNDIVLMRLYTTKIISFIQ
ncbi:hypothetical protein BOQ23_10320 [Listeria monocytogenes]|nr:hypothetical protein [Listeria monocytogenes]